MEKADKNRKFFLGGLSYTTEEEGLKEYFSKYGELVDVVVIRFPDTKRSRGFGFITYAEESQAAECFNNCPHNIEGSDVEVKWATPREEMEKEEESREPEAVRKVFVGGLSYSTTNEGLRDHFSKFGELVDCVVLRFHDTKRSRGFGFVTYSTAEEVDECQKARPHIVDGAKVETKRATPKDEAGRSYESESVKKVFIGGVKDEMTDEDFKEYFSQFGNVTLVDQMRDKSTGRKRGFAFVEFDDYDAVDKVVLKDKHHLKNWRIDVKKALSKSVMREERRGRDRMDRRGGDRGMRGGGGGGAPSPWQQQNEGGYGGGFNSGFGNQQFDGGFGSGGNSGFGGGGNSGFWGEGNNRRGGGGGMGSNPWQSNSSSNWENQGNGWGGGYDMNAPFENDRFGPRGGAGGMGGGPVRNQGMGRDNRSTPYSYGGGASRGGTAAGGGGYGRSRW